MQLFGIESGFQSGAFNMALDEALLEYSRSSLGLLSGSTAHAPQGLPFLIVRTYCWKRPTLSLGVNQPEKDVASLLRLYSLNGATPDIVRRPTGGRAILHGEDFSFSFVTNAPEITRLPLKDAYCLLTTWVRSALETLEVPIATACAPAEQAGDKDYLRSPVCFETQTASDLMADNGQKLAGSAQLRRAGGLLQHGAAFLKPYGVTPHEFTEALFTAVAAHYGRQSQGILPSFEVRRLDRELTQLKADYIRESGAILESASTTSGSHLEPASS